FSSFIFPAQFQQDMPFATALKCRRIVGFLLLAAILDARTLPAGTVLTPDLAIIGGGPAGISLALALADSGHDILLLESGGTTFESKAQSLYGGSQTGVPY